MKHGSTLFAVLLGACMLAGPALAQTGDSRHAQQHADAALASMRLEHDPFAPVHVVMARKSFDGMRDLIGSGTARADSVGTALVVSEIKAHMLSEISERIHQRAVRDHGLCLEPRHARAQVGVAEGRGCVEGAGEEPTAERAERHEPDAELVEHRQQVGLAVA